MEVLKALIVFIVVIGALAEDTKRQGRCGSKPVIRERYNNLKRKYQNRKPMPLHNDAGHKYNVDQSDYYPSNDYAKPETPYETQTSYETQTPYDDDSYNPAETEYAISPRISIGPNGEIIRGRALRHHEQRRHFHEDDSEEQMHRHHDLNDEDHDQHKIRTVRSTSSDAPLTAQSLNAVNGGNSANAGEYLIANAIGSNVEVLSTGSSTSSGTGSISATGTTNISQGSPGWSKNTYTNQGATSDQTPQGLAATLQGLGNFIQVPQSLSSGSATVHDTVQNSATGGYTASTGVRSLSNDKARVA